MFKLLTISASTAAATKLHSHEKNQSHFNHLGQVKAHSKGYVLDTDVGDGSYKWVNDEALAQAKSHKKQRFVQSSRGPVPVLGQVHSKVVSSAKQEDGTPAEPVVPAEASAEAVVPAQNVASAEAVVPAETPSEAVVPAETPSEAEAPADTVTTAEVVAPVEQVTTAEEVIPATAIETAVPTPAQPVEPVEGGEIVNLPGVAEPVEQVVSDKPVVVAANAQPANEPETVVEGTGEQDTTGAGEVEVIDGEQTDDEVEEADDEEDDEDLIADPEVEGLETEEPEDFEEDPLDNIGAATLLKEQEQEEEEEEEQSLGDKVKEHYNNLKDKVQEGSNTGLAIGLVLGFIAIGGILFGVKKYLDKKEEQDNKDGDTENLVQK